MDVIEALNNLFIVRKDCYPKQLEKKNEYIVVKKDLTQEILQSHLKGIITVGCFQIEPVTNKVKWICFDFDGELLRIEFEKAYKLFQKLKKSGFNPLMEFSGRRGYHVWLFIEPVDASVARKFAAEISKDSDVGEVFPKQDKLEKKGFGCQVKLPIGIHRVSGKRSYLFDENFKPLHQEMCEKLLIEVANTKKGVISIKDLNDFN